MEFNPALFGSRDRSFRLQVTTIKDRCTLLADFATKVDFLSFAETLDTDAVKPKWNQDKSVFLQH